MTKLTKSSEASKRIDRDEEGIEIGQWYWIDDREDGQWLGCVTEIGTNYAELSGPRDRHSKLLSRIHLDKWDEEIIKRENNPDAYINGKVEFHRHRVNALMGEIKQLTARLGITPSSQLTDGVVEQSTALVAAHKAPDIKKHKQALVKAKEETLPELFKKVEEENGMMAAWMKAQLIPLEAESKTLKKSTSAIEDRIFTVELYAGLCEDVEQIRKGEPASNDEKIHLFQRRHYMDEECLVNYSAGGMEFKNIGAFDSWLVKKANLNRILPLPRCVVAFQVRRTKKDREAQSLMDFISFIEFERADKLTYLYIRNGDQVYRLNTEIDFGHQLFPDEEHARLLSGGKLYIRHDYGVKPVTEAEYQDALARHKEAEDRYKRELAEWKAKPKDERSHFKPYFHDRLDKFEPLTPESVYYDDAMRQVGEEMRQHNRIATVLQGLLDRSPVFHPHPSWKLWTPEGFTTGIVLHYDETRAITVGDAPDFEAYRARLNASIVKGSHTVGQEIAWERHEAEKENERQERDWRIRNPIEYKRFRPYGNDGPGTIAVVQALSRDKESATFRWERERQRTKWVNDPDRYGYMKPDRTGVPAKFTCEVSKLLNVDEYTPGDYRQFYEDPRTRVDYLKWAPLLLAAEDWKAGKDA